MASIGKARPHRAADTPGRPLQAEGEEDPRVRKAPRRRVRRIAGALLRQADREELLSLKGIGLETADAILLYAGDKPILPVSAYAMRIFERLGVERPISLPKAGKSIYQWWQSFFMKDPPEDVEVCKEFHALLVELGKACCKARPNCSLSFEGGLCKLVD